MWKGIGRRWRWSRWGGGEYKGGNQGGFLLVRGECGWLSGGGEYKGGNRGFPACTRRVWVTSHYPAGLQARKPDGFLALRHSPHTRKEKRTDW